MIFAKNVNIIVMIFAKNVYFHLHTLVVTAFRSLEKIKTLTLPYYLETTRFFGLPKGGDEGFYLLFHCPLRNVEIYIAWRNVLNGQFSLFHSSDKLSFSLL